MIPQLTEEMPTKYPPEFPRTRIQDRKSNFHWKKEPEKYLQDIVVDMTHMDVKDILYTHSDIERLDSGVALWFSRKKQKFDFSWQDGLELDNPAPTLQEIDDAFRSLAAKFHPDKPGGGDPEMFKRLNDHRKEARAWVLGSHQQLELCVVCDSYTETRLNLAAIRFAMAAFRRLESVGIPGILDRTLSKTFSALPANVA